MVTGHQTPEHTYRMARLMRHEVGDLLQSVYSTVAVLLDRLPADMPLERRLIGELKNRAELCRSELEAVVELASDGEPASDRTDLDNAFSAALTQARQRYPSLPIEVSPFPGVLVSADSRALTTALTLLLKSMCQGARHRVRVDFARSDRHVDCLVERDGYPVTAEQLAWLHTPFPTTQQAAFGLGLALARRSIRRGGGEVEAENRPDGVVVVRIRFSVYPDSGQ
jgi:C4-dicarboxylate-specific signal transduction histidine kinase